MIKISDLYDDSDRTIEIFGWKLHWPLPIAFMLNGSSAIVFGYGVYAGKRPVVRAIHSVFKAISDAKYALMYRFVKEHQYHIIYTDLGYGYHCSDERILYGAMKCLEEYVEAGKHGGEKGLEEHIHEMRAAPDPNAPEGMLESHANQEEEALTIYRWWKYERPADRKKFDELLDAAYDGKSVQFVQEEGSNLSRLVFTEPTEAQRVAREAREALEEKMDEDEQSYLHRLITIRRGLWI